MPQSDPIRYTHQLGERLAQGLCLCFVLWRDGCIDVHRRRLCYAARERETGCGLKQRAERVCLTRRERSRVRCRDSQGEYVCDKSKEHAIGRKGCKGCDERDNPATKRQAPGNRSCAIVRDAHYTVRQSTKLQRMELCAMQI